MIRASVINVTQEGFKANRSYLDVHGKVDVMRIR